MFELFGGLSLFIYGIHLMGEGLQKVAAHKMRGILSTLTKNIYVAIFVGFIITAIIQSSSAFTVMLVGFVNAGLMEFTQSIGLIMGSCIGTTVTAQLVAFKLTKIALPTIMLGFGLEFFTKKYKHIGNAILGFGILFLGLNIMTESMEFLRTHGIVNKIFLYSSNSKFYIPLCIIAGTIITMMIQSSSASTGIIIALSMGNLIVLKTAIPLIFGCNIGTCVTALIASIGTSSQAKRTAWAHIIFKLIGVLLFIPLIIPFEKLVIFISGSSIPRQIANAHTIFNVSTTLIFIPFAECLSKLIIKLIKEKVEKSNYHLDELLIKTPDLAMERVRKEILRMIGISRCMLNASVNAFVHNNENKLDMVSEKEDITDILQTEITHYLISMSEEQLCPELSKEISVAMRMVNEIERIADHAENIAKISKKRTRNNLEFSKESITEILSLYFITKEFLDDVTKSFKNKDDYVKNCLGKESIINEFTWKYKNSCVKRFNKKHSVVHGLVFVDILNQIEKVGDHIFNMAELVLGTK